MSPSARFRLPDGWTAPETVEDVIVADDVQIHRAGLSTVGTNGEEVVGSAADCNGPALSRAWFELLERVSGMEAIRDARGEYPLLDESGQTVGSASSAELFPESDAPERWRYARSNGVALHADWTTACRGARWELAERDRVIRSWHGEIRPERMSIEPGAQPLGRAKSYDWLAYSFPEPNALAFSCGIEVVGVFGFPLRDGVPFVLGLAGRDSARAAFDAAAAEALQLLAFLWGEAPPDEAPHRPGPMQHLDTYQVPGAHHAVRRWLEGAHLEFGTKRPAASAGRIGYVDLTPAWLPSHLRVAKAVCDQAMPLVFGESPHSAHLPRQLRIHPIP